MPPGSLSLFLLCLGFATAHAEELVYLNNGFSLTAQSHTTGASGYTFQVGSGAVELPADAIARIEVLPAPPAVASSAQKPVETAETLLGRVASEEGLEVSFVRSVARAESGMRMEALSPKGAVGLMQLMPKTAAELGVDAAERDENALGGAKYLRALLLRYHGNTALALAAYNAGPGAVARYGGVPPYAETRNYIVRVTREYDRERKSQTLPAGRQSGSQVAKSLITKSKDQ